DSTYLPRVHLFPTRRSSDLIILVKCTPRKGNSGLGTGYINVFTYFSVFSLNLKYSPRKGIILTSVLTPLNFASLSLYRPAQLTRYLVSKVSILVLTRRPSSSFSISSTSLLY